VQHIAAPVRVCCSIAVIRAVIEPQRNAGDLDGGEIARARLVICRLEGPLGLFVDLDKVLGVRPRPEHFREPDHVTGRLLVDSCEVATTDTPSWRCDGARGHYPPMRNTAKPPVRFPEEVRRDLEAHRVGLANEFEQRMFALARPCVAVTSRRVADAPLRRSPLTNLFGARVAPPKLDVTASKFGGTPYCESVEDWSDHAFLGQIDLSEATAVADVNSMHPATTTTSPHRPLLSFGS